MAEPVIKTINLSKSYETPAGPLCVLSSIDLEIPKGGFLALVGPFDGGKTTLSGRSLDVGDESIRSYVSASNSLGPKGGRYAGHY